MRIVIIIAVIINISFSNAQPGDNINNIEFSKVPVRVDEITHFGSEDGYLHSLQLTFSDTALLSITHNFWWC